MKMAKVEASVVRHKFVCIGPCAAPGRGRSGRFVVLA